MSSNRKRGKPEDINARFLPETVRWTLDNLDVNPYSNNVEEYDYLFDCLHIVRTFTLTNKRLPKNTRELCDWEQTCAVVWDLN